jgi:phosphate acetyltransferase
MASNLYITTTEPRSGKSAIVLGIMELLLRNLGTVGFFRPIVDVRGSESDDRDIRLVRDYFELEPGNACYAYTLAEAASMLNDGRQSELLDGVLNRYKELESRCDFVLCEGTDFEGVTSAFEFDINVDIANNIGSPVMVITNGRDKVVDDIVGSTVMAVDSYEARGAQVLAAFINRCPTETLDRTAKNLVKRLSGQGCLAFALPEEPELGKPTPREIVQALDAEVLSGADRLDKPIGRFTVAAMEVHHFLDYVEEGGLVIVPGDRSDIVLASLASRLSTSYPDIAAILLTGGLRTEDTVSRLIEGWTGIPTPLLLAHGDTFSVTRQLTELHTEIDPADTRKIASALRLFGEGLADAEAVLWSPPSTACISFWSRVEPLGCPKRNEVSIRYGVPISVIIDAMSASGWLVGSTPGTAEICWSSSVNIWPNSGVAVNSTKASASSTCSLAAFTP